MFENEAQTRAAISGTGLLLGAVLLLARLPPVLLAVPVAILFLGIVADPEETHAVWYGMLNGIGIFDLEALTGAEKEACALKRHYFWLGEAGLAAVLAGSIAIPVGVFLAGRAEAALAFTGAAVLFLPLFVFLPRAIRRAMRADTAAVTGAFGKNEQIRNLFWTVFIAVAGLVLALVLDPAAARQGVAILTGMGG